MADTGGSFWQTAQRWARGGRRTAAQAAAPAPAHAEGALAPGSLLGAYRIERLLGRGSLTSLYLARAVDGELPVALKVLSLARAAEASELLSLRERFLREAEAARRLRHPDIVSVYDTGEDQGLAYIAMEAASGTDLSRYCRPSRLLPEPVVLRVVARVADALAYAHQQGVVHRDMKPANVMVDLGQHLLKVTDFGIAQLQDGAQTRTGVVAGTPSFMSPEQLAGGRTDGRSDLYSLGVMLFQLLTGRLPYEGDSMGRLLQAIAREAPLDLCAVRPELPPELGAVVARLLEKSPERRCAHGRELSEALRLIENRMGPLHPG